MKGTFLQPWPNFGRNYVIPSPQLKCFSLKSGEDQKEKKKVFTTIWDYIRQEFVGFIHAGWLLIVSSPYVQISMGGRLNLDGGTLTLDGGTCSPTSPLQFKYCLYCLVFIHLVQIRHFASALLRSA